MQTENKNIVSEPQPDYENAEMDVLRDGLKRSHTERFKMTTTLMKIGFLLRDSKIVPSKYLYLLTEQKIKKLRDEMNPGSNPL